MRSYYANEYLRAATTKPAEESEEEEEPAPTSDVEMPDEEKDSDDEDEEKPKKKKAPAKGKPKGKGKGKGKGGVQIPEEWPWEEAKQLFKKPDVQPSDEVEVGVHYKCWCTRPN